MLNLLGIKDWPAHGIGTARAFRVNELAGTFAGLAMALNGLATAILVPPLLGLMQ